MAELMLLHGSAFEIKKPTYGVGKVHNDYGPGFYCTQDEELASEWACKTSRDGYVNRYSLNTDGLKTFDFYDGTHNVVEWIGVLLRNRTFRINGELAEATRDYIIDNFSVDISDYDLVRGYRADDSYFQYAEAFVENTLSVNRLSDALFLGKLSVQTVVVSPKGFSKLKFIKAEHRGADEYYPLYIGRDLDARNKYKEMVGKRDVSNIKNEIFALDILREEIKRDDERLQRIILK